MDGWAKRPQTSDETCCVVYVVRASIGKRASGVWYSTSPSLRGTGEYSYNIRIADSTLRPMAQQVRPDIFSMQSNLHESARE